MVQRADEGIGPYGDAEGLRSCLVQGPTIARVARSEAERAEREADQMRPCTPLTTAPSGTGRQLQIRRRPKRARRPGKIGACTDTPTPVARGGPLHRSAPSAFFSSTGRGAFSFWARPKREWGAHPPWKRPPAGAEIPRAVANRPYRPRRSPPKKKTAGPPPSRLVFPDRKGPLSSADSRSWWCPSAARHVPRPPRWRPTTPASAWPSPAAPGW